MTAVLMMRSFLRGWWLVLSMMVALLGLLLAIAGSGGPTIAASNGTSMGLLMIYGWFAGSGVAALAGWPNRVLTPGFANSLLTMLILFLGVVTLACGTLSAWMGNPMPAAGPFFCMGLASAYTLLLVFGRPVALLVGLVLFLAGPFVLFAAAAGLHDGLFNALSRPSSQIVALVLAGVLILLIKRRLDSPDFEPPAILGPFTPGNVQDTPSYGSLVAYGSHSKRLARELLYGLLPVGAALALLRVGSELLVVVAFSVACIATALVRTEIVCGNIHRFVHFYWLAGAADSRSSLGRWCAITVLIAAIAWLPGGILGAHILEPGPALQTVLIVQVAVFFKIILTFGRAKTVPAGSARNLVAFGVASFFGYFAPMTAHSEFSLPVTVALVVGLVGTGGLAVLSVRRTVSRAPILL